MSATWTDRIWREWRQKNLTTAFRDVLLTLRTYRGHGGLICPAQATLAARARCTVRTVARALRHAQTLGLVSWAERRVRRGWRWFRTSNRYRLTVPDSDVQAGNGPVWPRRATTGQNVGGGESRQKEVGQSGHKTALARMMAEAAVMPDLLAMRRATADRCGALATPA